MSDFDFGLTFDELRKANTKRATTSKFADTCKDWIVSDWAMAMMGEGGEACNLIKKARRGEPVSQSDIAKEIADTIIYADLLAHHLGIDLGSAIRQKFNEVSRRIGSDVSL